MIIKIYILPSITSFISLQLSGCLNHQEIGSSQQQADGGDAFPEYALLLCSPWPAWSSSFQPPRSAIMGICMVLSPNMTPICLVLSMMVKLYSMP